MTIKKRLVLSNLLMLVVPALLVVLVSVGALVLFVELYWDSIQGVAQSQETVIAVQSLLDVYRHDNAEAKRSGKPLKSVSELETLLYGMGYRLSVRVDGQEVRSNLTASDQQAAAKLSDGFAGSEESVVFMTGSATLVRESFLHKGMPVVMTAISSATNISDTNIGKKIEIFVQSYIWGLLAAVILMIALTNGILSSRATRSLLRPLRLLGVGARQIQSGNLDFEIRYDGNDEFREVCQDFDAMRVRLRDSVRQRLKYEEDRREFIAGISHDLRTPMTAIKGYVEGLRDGVANTPEKQRRYLDTIYRKTCDMDALVDRLFLLSKLETGHFPFHFTMVELGDYLTGFVESVHEEFAAKGLDVAFENRADCPLKIRLDLEQMRWVLLNLLQNSAKYKSKEQGEARITLDWDGPYAVITVADDGPGVPKQDLDRLCDSFYRGDKARSNPGSGSGLGLAIARRIVEAHGGAIELKNSGGLTVELTLNRLDAPDQGDKGEVE